MLSPTEEGSAAYCVVVAAYVCASGAAVYGAVGCLVGVASSLSSAAPGLVPVVYVDLGVSLVDYVDVTWYVADYCACDPVDVACSVSYGEGATSDDCVVSVDGAVAKAGAVVGAGAVGPYDYDSSVAGPGDSGYDGGEAS